MKIGNLRRIVREEMPDAPAGEWLEQLIKTTNEQGEQFTQALQGNISFADNTNSNYKTVRATHGVPLTISNPLKVRPVGISAVAVKAVQGGSRYAVADIDWGFVDSTDPKTLPQISLTVNYDLAHTYPTLHLSKSGAQPVATTSAVAVTWQTTDYSRGSDITLSSNSRINFVTAGEYAFSYNVAFDDAATTFLSYVTVNGGTDRLACQASTGDSLYRASSCVVLHVDAGDYAEVYVEQTTGGDLDLPDTGHRQSFLKVSRLYNATTPECDVTLFIHGG